MDVASTGSAFAGADAAGGPGLGVGAAAGLYETVTRRGFWAPQVNVAPSLISNCCGSGTARTTVLPASSFTLNRNCLPTQSTRTSEPVILGDVESSNHSTVFAAASRE